MPGVMRPPFGAPTGPLLGDAALVADFVAGARTGHSAAFHIEEDTLLVERFVAVALRLAPGALLIRTDVDPGAVPALSTRAGLHMIEADPPLATVVALQALGLPAAVWELWGTDPGAAGDALRSAAAGGTGGPRGG